MKAEMTTWDARGDDDGHHDIRRVGEIKRLVLTMATVPSSAFVLEQPPRALVISAEPRGYAVTLRDPDDGSADSVALVADPAAEGEVEFVIGGQTNSGWPLAWIATADQAVAVAREFFLTGTIDRTRSRWE